MKAKHTPTPWEWEDYMSGYKISKCKKDGRDNLAIVTRNQEANAEFIVKACNSHDALVEALEFASTALFQISHDGDINPQAVIEYIEKALTKAKEK